VVLGLMERWRRNVGSGVGEVEDYLGIFGLGFLIFGYDVLVRKICDAR
jgi:hypothetical protein